MGNFKSYRQLRVSERKEASLGQKIFEERDLKFAKSGEKKNKNIYRFQKISKSQTRKICEE